MQIPTQYRMLYLLSFLYAHQDKKVIVFASTCETVNLLTQMCKSIDWDACINRRGNVEKKEAADAPSTAEKATVDFMMPNSMPDKAAEEEAASAKK